MKNLSLFFAVFFFLFGRLFISVHAAENVIDTDFQTGENSANVVIQGDDNSVVINAANKDDNLIMKNDSNSISKGFSIQISFPIAIPLPSYAMFKRLITLFKKRKGK